MAAQQSPQRNQLAATFLQSLMRGGAAGGDPYANESAGPFATSPRIYARGQGNPAVRASPAAAAVVKPSGGAGKGKAAPAKTAAGPGNAALAAKTYDMLTPPGVVNPANATSPSSLMVSPPAPASGGPGGGTMTGQAPPGGPGGGTQTGQPPGTPYQNTMPNVPLPGPGGPGGGTMTGQPAPAGGSSSWFPDFGFNQAVTNFEQSQGKPSQVPRMAPNNAANALASTPVMGAGPAPTQGGGVGPGSPFWNWITGITGGN